MVSWCSFRLSSSQLYQTLVETRRRSRVQGFWRPCKLPYVNILRCRYQRVHKRGGTRRNVSRAPFIIFSPSPFHSPLRAFLSNPCSLLFPLDTTSSSLARSSSPLYSIHLSLRLLIYHNAQIFPCQPEPPSPTGSSFRSSISHSP